MAHRANETPRGGALAIPSLAGPGGSDGRVAASADGSARRRARAVPHYPETMAILIDPPRWPAHGTLWSHLVSDVSYEELHAFAAHLRLPRRSFDLDHYDLPAARYAEALQFGARAVAARDIVAGLRTSGLRVRHIDRARVRPGRRRDYLRAEWQRVGDLIGIRSRDAWTATGENLLARYAEPHRRYHDERHLEDVLLALDHLWTRGEVVTAETLTAAWFHDAVYAGRPGDDEAASARLALSALEAHDVDAAVAQRVATLIVATTPGRADSVVDAPAAHLFDADLAIFAAPRPRYEEYAAGVRAEYAHVPGDAFRAGRARVLREFTERRYLYATPAARDLWEERARRNLARELAELTPSGHRLDPW